MDFHGDSAAGLRRDLRAFLDGDLRSDSCGDCQSDFPPGLRRRSQVDSRRDLQGDLRDDLRGDFDGVPATSSRHRVPEAGGGYTDWRSAIGDWRTKRRHPIAERGRAVGGNQGQSPITKRCQGATRPLAASDGWRIAVSGCGCPNLSHPGGSTSLPVIRHFPYPLRIMASMAYLAAEIGGQGSGVGEESERSGFGSWARARHYPALGYLPGRAVLCPCSQRHRPAAGSGGGLVAVRMS